jgi:DNA-binding transcriptional ArsR family regulator/DNA-binding CsgD family transcriptional regulator
MLEAVGVSAEDLSTYRCLLASPHVTVAELAARLNGEHSAVRRSVARLEKLGLVTRTAGRPRRLVAARPDVAVDVLVARRREELHQAQLAARELLAEMVVEDQHRPDRLVEVVVGRAAVATRFAQLLQGTRRELLVLDRPPYAHEPAGADTRVRRLLREGVAVRGIYDHTSLARPGALADALDLAAAGEESRMHPAVPMKLAIADRTLALLPLAASDAVDTALVVRPCALLDALCALFELLWTHSLPLADPVPPGSAAATQPWRADTEDEALLVALGAGLKDDAIARQLGLSTRTVSRRVAKLMEQLQARTRFQAGRLVERRLWLGTAAGSTEPGEGSG